MKSAGRVLIVEDDEAVVTHLVTSLERIGLEVAATAPTGEAALLLAGERSPDIVLMDIGLGGALDGVATAAAFLERGGPPVIFLTARADAATFVRARAVEPVGYLTKPFQDASLRAVVEIGLQQRAVRRRLEASEAEARATEARLRAMVSRYETLLRMASDAIHVLDLKGNVLEVSDAFCRLLGYSREELLRLNVTDWDPELTPNELLALFARLSSVGRAETLERRHRRKDGRIIDVEINGCGVEVDGTTLIYASARDVSERQRANRELVAASVTDELTGLRNRRGFMLLAEQQMKLAHRNRKPLILFFVDINGMKEINDTLGHRMGDRALLDTATLLPSVFRESDVIARLGGDEFVVLATESAVTGGPILTSRLRMAVAERNHQGAPFQLSLSVGTAMFDPANPVTIEQLLADADARMYEEKRTSQRPRAAHSLADEIKSAVGGHAMWMENLRAMIEERRLDVSADLVASDDSCEFGRWLNDAPLPEAAKRHPRYSGVKQLHNEFHKIAAGVVRLALAERHGDALLSMDPSSDLARVSAVLTREMMAWANDVSEVPTLPPFVKR